MKSSVSSSILGGGFLAGLLSGALMLAVLTAPARADQEANRIIGGLAGLYILNEVFKNAEVNSTQTAPAVSQTSDSSRLSAEQIRHETYRDRYRSEYRHPSEWGRSMRPGHARNRKVAPRRCLSEIRTGRGYRKVYAARCMQREARTEPPRECLRRSRSDERPRRFYDKKCLRENGWRV